MEKELNAYIGDVVNGLAKEAAYWKARFNGADAELVKLKLLLEKNGINASEHYINKEPIEPQRPQA
jgi:hypothetical protein